MKDLYEILGVAKDADQHGIRSAYKLMARRVHPDKVGGSTEAFQELNEAYSILRNPDKRARYDAGESTVDKTPLERVAIARLGAMFQEAIKTAEDHKDLIETIRMNLSQGSINMHQNVNKINEEIDKFKHVLDRVKYNGNGGDIFTGQVELTISQLNDQLSKQNEEIEIGKLVLNMLNDYECDVKEPTYPTYLTTGPSGAGYYFRY